LNDDGRPEGTDECKVEGMGDLDAGVEVFWGEVFADESEDLGEVENMKA
jgi:hypothetical protein